MRLIAILITAISALANACDPPPPPAPERYETIAFCGVDSTDPNAATIARTLHDAAGIDVMMSPCKLPSPGYSPAFPGDRYPERNRMADIVRINAAAGMKTIVYDAGIWSDNAVFRQSVIDYWRPLYANIYAWDMGDEFMPEQWDILNHRWNVILDHVEPVTGIGPFTNEVGNPDALERHLQLRNGNIDVSFDMYLEDQGEELAYWYNDSFQTLGCGINALDHWTAGVHLVPTPQFIVDTMRRLAAVGCDRFLIFGGRVPYGTNDYGAYSLVNNIGQASGLAAAVKTGAS